jgi:hypothetical protein
MFRPACAAVLALVLSGCTDDVSTSTITGTTVLTYHDPDVDFGTFRTYAITNKIAFYSDTGGVPTYGFVPAPAVFAAIEANMAARGYVKVAVVDPQNPPAVPPDADLALNPVVLEGSRTAYYPCDWWDWWSYPSYGCSSPWTYVPYTVGTLLLPLADLRNPPPPGGGKAFAIVWSGVGYAVLGTSSDTAVAVKAVNQAFAQSPYLVTP